MAEQLVESMTVDWNPPDYHDEYRDALMKWIDKKARASGNAEAPATESEEKEEGSAEIIDMMVLLKKSVKKDSTGAKRGGQAKSRSKPANGTKTQAKSKSKRRPAAARPKRSAG